MTVVYLAHPLGAGPKRAQNRANAARWFGYLSRAYGNAFIADWIILSGEWEETPENREQGLRCDLALVERADELWMVGGRVSAGMLLEADHARRCGKKVVDMTYLGYEVPA
jgi:hypothetical protein